MLLTSTPFTYPDTATAPRFFILIQSCPLFETQLKAQLFCQTSDPGRRNHCLPQALFSFEPVLLPSVQSSVLCFLYQYLLCLWSVNSCIERTVPFQSSLHSGWSGITRQNKMKPLVTNVLVASVPVRLRGNFSINVNMLRKKGN